MSIEHNHAFNRFLNELGGGWFGKCLPFEIGRAQLLVTLEREFSSKQPTGKVRYMTRISKGIKRSSIKRRVCTHTGWVSLVVGRGERWIILRSIQLRL